MMGGRTWPIRSGGTITTNVEGFEPMGAEAMAAALVASGLISEKEAAAALERRRQRRADPSIRDTPNGQ